MRSTMWQTQSSGPPMLLLAVLLATACTYARGISIVPGSSLFTSIRSPKQLVLMHPESTKLRHQDMPADFTARPMTDKNGKQYVCYLPPKDKLNPPEPPPEVEIPADPKAPLDLLERLSTVCLYRQEGLWTYEMCYRKQARQFRQAVSEVQTVLISRLLGNDKGEDFSCGSYHEDAADPDEIKEDPASPPGQRILYVSHRMTGGAPCALSGARRATEVRFTCLPDVQDSVVTSVREFPTCNYIFTVATPLLCKHPLFKPPLEEVHTITCLPTHLPDKPQDTGRQIGGDVQPRVLTSAAVNTAQTDQGDQGQGVAEAVPAGHDVGQAGDGAQATAGGTAAHWEAHKEALKTHFEAVIRNQQEQAGAQGVESDVLDHEAMAAVQAALQERVQVLQQHIQAVHDGMRTVQQAAIDESAGHATEGVVVAGQDAVVQTVGEQGGGSEAVQAVKQAVPEPQQAETGMSHHVAEPHHVDVASEQAVPQQQQAEVAAEHGQPQQEQPEVAAEQAAPEPEQVAEVAIESVVPEVPVVQQGVVAEEHAAQHAADEQQPAAEAHAQQAVPPAAVEVPVQDAPQQEHTRASEVQQEEVVLYEQQADETQAVEQLVEQAAETQAVGQAVGQTVEQAVGQVSDVVAPSHEVAYDQQQVHMIEEEQPHQHVVPEPQQHEVIVEQQHVPEVTQAQTHSSQQVMVEPQQPEMVAYDGTEAAASHGDGSTAQQAVYEAAQYRQPEVADQVAGSADILTASEAAAAAAVDDVRQSEGAHEAAAAAVEPGNAERVVAKHDEL